MTWDDDEKKPANPVFHGGKDRTTANKMLRTLGGSDGFRQRIDKAPDGTVTTLRTKDGMPQVEVSRPQVADGIVRGFVFKPFQSTSSVVASLFFVIKRAFQVSSQPVGYTVASSRPPQARWNDVFRIDGTTFFNNGRKGDVLYTPRGSSECGLPHWKFGRLYVAYANPDEVVVFDSTGFLGSHVVAHQIPYARGWSKGVHLDAQKNFVYLRSFSEYVSPPIPIPDYQGWPSPGNYPNITTAYEERVRIQPDKAAPYFIADTPPVDTQVCFPPITETSLVQTIVNAPIVYTRFSLTGECHIYAGWEPLGSNSMRSNHTRVFFQAHENGDDYYGLGSIALEMYGGGDHLLPFTKSNTYLSRGVVYSSDSKEDSSDAWGADSLMIQRGNKDGTELRETRVKAGVVGREPYYDVKITWTHLVRKRTTTVTWERPCWEEAHGQIDHLAQYSFSDSQNVQAATLEFYSRDFIRTDSLAPPYWLVDPVELEGGGYSDGMLAPEPVDTPSGPYEVTEDTYVVEKTSEAKSRDYIFSDVEEDVHLYLDVKYTVSEDQSISPATPRQSSLVVKYVLDLRGVCYNFDVFDGPVVDPQFPPTETSYARTTDLDHWGSTRSLYYATPLPPPPGLLVAYSTQGMCPFIAFTTKAEEAAGTPPEFYLDLRVQVRNRDNGFYYEPPLSSFNPPLLRRWSEAGAREPIIHAAPIIAKLQTLEPTDIQFANGVIGPWAQKLGEPYTVETRLEISRI